jgi:hypothetical protein
VNPCSPPLFSWHRSLPKETGFIKPYGRDPDSSVRDPKKGMSNTNAARALRKGRINKKCRNGGCKKIKKVAVVIELCLMV